METLSEMIDAAVECFHDSDKEEGRFRFFRYREEIIMCGYTPQHVDRLLLKAGLPEAELLNLPRNVAKEAQASQSFAVSTPPHGGFGGSQFVH